MTSWPPLIDLFAACEWHLRRYPSISRPIISQKIKNIKKYDLILKKSSHVNDLVKNKANVSNFVGLS